MDKVITTIPITPAVRGKAGGVAGDVAASGEVVDVAEEATMVVIDTIKENLAVSLHKEGEHQMLLKSSK
jgi:hypothetical protein